MESNWIWLPKSKYADRQNTFFNPLGQSKASSKYTVCSFKKSYIFDSVPVLVEMTYTADTAFLLMCNGDTIARGPAYSGGDFLGNDKPRGDYYAFKSSYVPSEPSLDFEAIVRMEPYHLCEYSRGHGGFYFYATIYFENGEKITALSDDSWSVKLLNSYTSPRFFDNSSKILKDTEAEIVPDIWSAEIAPIPPCTLEKAYSYKFSIAGGERLEKTIEYPRVFAGFVKISARTQGKVSVKLLSFELESRQSFADCTFYRSDTYYSLELSSIGGLDIDILNEGSSPCEIEISIERSFYPVNSVATTKTSDEELNELLNISAHTLKYCRQSHHLDSPLHCEPLACVGDYYIEMQMTRYSFGDFSLCLFDLKRIARTIADNDGRFFHTSYSLIWVKMLYECYMLTGKRDILDFSRTALDMLLARFNSYLGENGIIETPPDFMFVDWLVPDGISMHHPPKALGQSCLNIFYFDALLYAGKIYEVLGDRIASNECYTRREKLKTSIFKELYDEERGLFFEGLNTDTPEALIYQYMPKNVKKRYYRRHANILACYTGLIEGEGAKRLLDLIYENESLGEVQPYFMHFWLDAVYRCGYREKYTLLLLEKWKEALRISNKGLPEGFYPPEPSYRFDYSHAWGGTPLFSLPHALCGVEILEAGYKAIRLNPSLLGLDSARVEIKTPMGEIVIEQRRGENVKALVPKNIKILD